MSLEFYNLNVSYCKYLHQYDFRVPLIDNGKDKRPFVGILLTIREVGYYAPLTSPKEKHIKMKNAVDFIKIEEGRYGAINLNNMIPVSRNFLSLADTNILETDSQEIKNYKFLQKNQLHWCNSNKSLIINHAVRLHKLITEKRAPEFIEKRCCDFVLLEKIALKYNVIHETAETTQRKFAKQH